MANKKRDWSINREAVKALVAVYGPNEAARQAKLPRGTVLSWCRRYKWKKANGLIHTSGINGDLNHTPADPADAISRAMANHKQESTLNLAKYTEKASRKAAESTDPLTIARSVRDVAQVYRVLYPPEEGGEMIEGAILVGNAPVTDNHAEMLATAAVVDDVRQELPDERPESD